MSHIYPDPVPPPKYPTSGNIYRCGSCGSTFPDGYFHTCSPVEPPHAKEQDAPSEAPQAGGGAGALPEEVEENLESLLTMVHAFSDLGRKAGVRFLYNTFRHHFQKLTAERDALRAEVVRLNSVGAAKTSTIAALCDTADEIERQARLDALTEVRDLFELGCDDIPPRSNPRPCETCEGVHRQVVKKIARLEQPQPPPSEAASGQEGRG